MRQLIFIFLCLIPHFIFGQKIKREWLEILVPSIETINSSDNYWNYTSKIIDLDGTLKFLTSKSTSSQTEIHRIRDSRMWNNRRTSIRNSRALTHYNKAQLNLRLKNYYYQKDSAHLRIYVFVGKYERKPVEFEKATYIMRPDSLFYKRIIYTLPLYLQVYDCTGALILERKSVEEKEYFYGNNFHSVISARNAWKEGEEGITKSVINHSITEQNSIWSDTISGRFKSSINKESIIFFKPKKKNEAYTAFKKGIDLNKDLIYKTKFSIHRRQHLIYPKKSYTNATKIAQISPINSQLNVVIGYWREKVEKYEKTKQKLYPASLYNLSVLCYVFDRLDLAEEYCKRGLKLKFKKNYFSQLLHSIKRAKKYLNETNLKHRVINPPYCTIFKALIEEELINNIPPTILDILLTKKQSITQFDLLTLENGIVKQGFIEPDSSHSSWSIGSFEVTPYEKLNKGIYFTSLDGKGQKEKKIFYASNQIKRFTLREEIYVSYAMEPNGKKHFMKVLVDGHIKLLNRKRNVVDSSDGTYYLKRPEEDYAIKVFNFNFEVFLKNIPQILEKFRKGVYGNKENKEKFRVNSSEHKNKGKYLKKLIQEYNEYYHKQNFNVNEKKFNN